MLRLYLERYGFAPLHHAPWDEQPLEDASLSSEQMDARSALVRTVASVTGVLVCVSSRLIQL